ncbi:MAG TPA: flagellar FlbD family protein [Acidimicrobiales bacterium]|nr:flagellar FlbD family protein [Acidimicrobiales bacterium]
MIPLTRFHSGELIALNPDLVERIEETPDTVVTLTTGTRYVVEETIDEITARICAYRATVFNIAMRSADHHEMGRPAHLRVVRDTPTGSGSRD